MELFFKENMWTKVWFPSYICFKYSEQQLHIVFLV